MNKVRIVLPCKLIPDHDPTVEKKIIKKGDYEIDFLGCPFCFEIELVDGYIIAKRKEKLKCLKVV